MLSERDGLRHISTGILLRRAIRSESEFGKQVREYVQNGKLVPGRMVRSLAEDAIEEQGFENYVLDGYPRTIEQAEWLTEFLHRNDSELNAVISLSVPDDIIVDRLSKRRVHRKTGENYHLDFKPPPEDVDEDFIIQREDDKPDSIRKRLGIYKAETQPVEQYYRDRSKLLEVDGVGSFEDVYARIKDAVASHA
jgi:adenylate kinase